MLIMKDMSYNFAFYISTFHTCYAFRVRYKRGRAGTKATVFVFTHFSCDLKRTMMEKEA